MLLRRAAAQPLLLHSPQRPLQPLQSLSPWHLPPRENIQLHHQHRHCRSRPRVQLPHPSPRQPAIAQPDRHARAATTRFTGSTRYTKVTRVRCSKLVRLPVCRLALGSPPPATEPFNYNGKTVVGLWAFLKGLTGFMIHHAPCDKIYDPPARAS